MMLLFLPLCSGVLLWFHSFSSDIARAGAGWALSLGCGALEHLWAQRGQVPGQHCWLRAHTHTASAPSVSSWHRMLRDTSRAHLLSGGLGCAQSSVLGLFAAISLPWAGCHSRLQHPGGLRVCSQLSKAAKLKSQKEISCYSLLLFCCLKRKWKVVWIFTGWNSQVSENSLQELQHSFSALLQSSFISQISVSVTVLIALAGFVVLMQHSELYFWGLIWKTISCWKLFICLAVSLKK